MFGSGGRGDSCRHSLGGEERQSWIRIGRGGIPRDGSLNNITYARRHVRMRTLVKSFLLIGGLFGIVLSIFSEIPCTVGVKIKFLFSFRSTELKRYTVLAKKQLQNQ